ncbi:circadian clock protein KaiC [Anaeroselena agilis]|uniref:non-specific serine/threonine protein kinase n=1 Tax=Anaeroselena agilis TaxID=3063788 RepID=A0ABU3NTM3_9FIRM|nr:circadian clock protein KaiC [Selenomonadales bacterium 4137-cl]
MNTIRTTESIRKCPTGIQGLDEITCGGLPRGRTSLVCGAAGCGKTMLAMQFLVNGSVLYGEPGVFMSFEENEQELAANFASLGADLEALTKADKLRLDYVRLERSEISETGDYDLEGLFVRLDYAIKAVGAKRVVLDTIEALFAGLDNANILRAELRRLFRWLKDRGMTAVVTAEKGDGALTRHGIEEYVSDCVLVLDHRAAERISTRHLRVLKYRGSSHGTNEYPFLIDEQGISVMPVTSVGLDAPARTGKISSGVERLDKMLGGEGYYEGSSILISGTAGTGKTTLAAYAVDAACRRGEKCVYFAFEESPGQIERNLRSVGLDLRRWVDGGLLKFAAARPTFHGLEMHLVSMYKKIEAVNPGMVVVDPISNLTAVGTITDVKIMLTRLIDFLKMRGSTLLMLDLSTPGHGEETELGVSSLADTWIALRDIEFGGERNRGLYILKSRGMAHSNQIREFVIGAEGIELLDVYTGKEGVLTGSARCAQELREREEERLRLEEIGRKRQEIERRRKQLAVRVAELEAAFAAEKEELEKSITREEAELRIGEESRDRFAALRKAD